MTELINTDTFPDSSVSILTDLLSKRPLIAVVGPTASGKSDLAQDIALQLDGEVVSADSMQIYRGMDIATGKLAVVERKVPHYGLDIVNPDEPYSAAVFQSYARSCLFDIAQRGKRPILCGGTSFYVRAAIDDYRFPEGEQLNNSLREYHVCIVEEQGFQALWDMLNACDSRSASVIAPQNVKRVSRALEMYEQGISYADQVDKLQTIPQLLPTIFIGLRVDRDVLNARIERRVDRMISNGLVEETKVLVSQGFKETLTASAAIGYHQIISYLDGEKSFEEAVEDIKTATRRYAKRQRTWLRKDMRINWIDANELDHNRLLEESLAIIRQQDSALLNS